MCVCVGVGRGVGGGGGESLTYPQAQEAEPHVPFRKIEDSYNGSGVQTSEAGQTPFALSPRLLLSVEVVADAAGPAADPAIQTARLVGQSVERLARVLVNGPRGQGRAALQDGSVESFRLNNEVIV